LLKASEANKRHRRNERDRRHHHRLCTIAVVGARAFLLARRNLRFGLFVRNAARLARTVRTALLAVGKKFTINKLEFGNGNEFVNVYIPFAVFRVRWISGQEAVATNAFEATSSVRKVSKSQAFVKI
jgi:hypothetical protein